MKRYYISYYVIVPVIVAGYAVFAAILSFRVTQYCIKHGLDYSDPLYWTLAVIAVVGCVFGLSVVWVILKPVQSFVEKAMQLSAIPMEESGGRKDEIGQMTRVFEQVTSVLSMVDARQLFPDIVAESKAMRGILGQIMKVAPTDSTVLILGESGTGKELVATNIFKHSSRRDKPFIKFNCTAVPEQLWEAELFGFEKGSFTGAHAKKIGKFEMANTGTLFLDEIGDMPLDTQAKILRVLQEREFERVGGNKTVKIDVRFIAATNKDLKRMVDEKKFREDLYFRLNVFYILLPPLRERPEDVQVLAEHFCKQAPKPVTISPLSLQLLANSDWPGNIRELQNVIERASVMTESGVIEPRHLPDNILGNRLIRAVPSVGSDNGNPDSAKKLSIDEQLGEIEKSMIVEALRQSSGIQVKAANLLGINQRSLWHRVKKFDIDPKTFRND